MPSTPPRTRDAGNSGGWVVHVAIADVAHYVRPGTRLDREAQLRGNSVYFPDRVVPMLPEPISNDLCSLKEREERPCLAVRLVFDKHGNKKGHTFLRAMMRSAAKLAYEEAQAAIDGRPSAKCKPLMQERARAAVGGLPGGGPGARPPRAARPRPARAQDRARRRGPCRARGSARAARGASPHRGVHDPGQRGGGRDARGQARARRLPRARCALQGEARGLARVPGEPGAQAAGRRRAAGRGLQPRAAARQVDAGRRPRQRDRAALAIASRLRRREPRAFRAASAPLRALHLADPPLRRPRGAPLADPRSRARRRRPRRRGGGAARRHRADHLRYRAARHGGRARDHRPADRRLSRRPRRGGVRRAQSQA